MKWFVFWTDSEYQDSEYEDVFESEAAMLEFVNRIAPHLRSVRVIRGTLVDLEAIERVKAYRVKS